MRDIVLVARQAQAAGKELLYLNIGDPNQFDFATPPHVMEAICRAVRDNLTGYAPSEGLPDAIEAIRRYPWPGNVRQLQNAMQQIVVLSSGSIVDTDMLPDSVTSGQLDSGVAAIAAVAMVTPIAVASAQHAHIARRQQVEPLWLTEKNAVEDAINACGGNVNQAAGLLEVAPSTLYRKIQSWKNLQA